MQEKVLMKGNEAIAEAAIRCGCRHYLGYPITPQTEIAAYMAKRMPKIGGVFLQAESEIAAINMVYGVASTGKLAMTSSSSPGIALKCEGISYLAGADLPALIVNVQRGGPGLGGIQPSQSDYFLATRGPGHGDFHVLVLAPASVQEAVELTQRAFDVADQYRMPAMILGDGVIGQMMEKVVLSPARPRWTDDRIAERCGAWAATGKPSSRGRNIVTSVELDSLVQERFNLKLKAKYDAIRRDEVRFEQTLCDDADYVLVAYGSSARIALKVVEMARADGHRVGLLRPITLFPFPTEAIDGLSRRVKGFLSVEMSTGQMVEDVMLASRFRVPVRHYGRTGGVVH